MPILGSGRYHWLFAPDKPTVEVSFSNTIRPGLAGLYVLDSSHTKVADFPNQFGVSLAVS